MSSHILNELLGCLLKQVLEGSPVVLSQNSHPNFKHELVRKYVVPDSFVLLEIIDEKFVECLNAAIY